MMSVLDIVGGSLPHENHIRGGESAERLLESKTVRKRVLIVEDDEDNAAILRAALDSEGYELAFARSLGDAMNACVATDPDVIVLDLALPQRLEGLRLVDWYFTQDDPHAKIVVLSAVGRDVLDEVREDPRVAAVMSKPYALEELLARVASVVRDG